MSQGARNWPFLTWTAAPVAGGRRQEIGLATQERRDLQDVDGLGHRLALVALVDVGDHRAAVARAHLGERLDALGEPEAAGAAGAGAVRLVEAALVDQAEPARAAHLDQGGGGLERMLAAFDLARPGDQHHRQIVADRERNRCRRGAAPTRARERMLQPNAP